MPMTTENLPAEIDDASTEDDWPEDGKMFDVESMVTQYVSLGTDDYLRNQPIELGERTFFLVEATCTGDGRKITGEGLRYTSAHDINIIEIDHHTFQKAALEANRLPQDES